MVTFKVEGLKELRERLLKFPEELRTTALRSAVSAGAKVVQDEAVTRAPEDTGTLKRAIYRSRSKDRSSAVQETYIVGVRSGGRYKAKKKKDGSITKDRDAWHWKFIEFGTRKMLAKPFLRPAFESTIKQQLETLRERLSLSIERIARRLAK